MCLQGLHNVRPPLFYLLDCRHSLLQNSPVCSQHCTSYLSLKSTIEREIKKKTKQNTHISCSNEQLRYLVSAELHCVVQGCVPPF